MVLKPNLTEVQRTFSGALVLPEIVPYVTVILGNNTGSVCTGSLIALDLVLTLARCLYDGFHQWEFSDSLTVLSGVSTLTNLTAQASVQKRYVSSISLHPNFQVTAADPSFGYNDIAILMVDEPFKETDSVKPTPVGDIDWTVSSDVKCKMAGFGAVNPLSFSPEDDHLKLHEVVATRRCDCQQSLINHFGHRVDRWICLRPEGNPGPCVGSAGAGLVCDGKLLALNVGIIPFSDLTQCIFRHTPMVSCESKYSLAIFLDLCPYLPWIHFNYREISAGPINCSKSNSLYPSLTAIVFVASLLGAYTATASRVYI
ncbi:serine-type endopeptidase activity protein [Homalodisca vitripennis]|nr:serine-type endopeptidase activity protein [Homalodisca vitripennis]KAG8311685.1 serine-type endopeptidase activity protein [Homalodisca vitripennis]